MPSTSKKQHNFMAMVAHNPKMAKKVGVPQSVGAEFIAADKGKKFKNGGGPVFSKIKNLFKGKDDPKEEMKEAKAIKSGKITPAQYAKGEKMEKAMPVHRGMKKGGKVKCYSGTNESVVKATPKPVAVIKKTEVVVKPASPAAKEEADRVRLRDEGMNMFDDQSAVNGKKKGGCIKMKKGGNVGLTNMSEKVTALSKGYSKGYAKGGGIESRGKTKGRFV